MQVVQTAVKTVTMNVALIRTVIAQLPNRGVHLFIICYQGAAITEGAEILLDNEAGGGRIAQMADLEIGSGSANGLGVIFDQAQVMFVRDFLDGDHVGALSV